MIATPYLLKDLKETLTAAVDGLKLREPFPDGREVSRTGETRYRAPSVFCGSLPALRSVQPLARDAAPPNAVPYIIIRLTDQEYDIAGRDCTAVAQINIIYAVYAPGNDPEVSMDELLNLSDRLALVFSTKQIWGDGHWRHEMPFKVTCGSGKMDTIYNSGSQEFDGPFFGGGIETKFTAAGLPKEVPYGITDA